MKENRENIFQKLGRWVTRMFMGPAYEDRMYRKSKKAEEKKDGENKPDDSELIVSPGRQVLQRFFERKFAVISVAVVLIMFCVVFIGPLFMPKYYEAYTETTQKDLPPTMSFMKVPKELQNDIKMIDNYGSFTVGLSNSGKVYVWGITRIGATGLDVQHIPEEVQNAKIEWVSAGIDHIIAIDENGKFYGWGSNQFGQYAVNEKVLSNPNLAPVPDEVLDGVDPDQIQKVTSGYQASAILMQDGTLYIWGNKQAYSNIDSFIGKTNMEDVDFTLNYVVGLTKDRNSVFCGVRGLYNTARAAIGDKGTKMTEFLNGRKIESVTATTKSICCLLDDGSVALVGDFPTDTIQVPTLAEGEYYTEIQGGAYHFTACTNLGHVYSWGGDHFYQAEAPTGKITNAAKVYTGSFQSYAVDENDQLLGKWGLKGYLFGTDDAGADIASRVVAGGRVTMTVGAIAVIIEILIGVTIGLISGYAGGWVDILLMRIAEVFYSIPLYPFIDDHGDPGRTGLARICLYHPCPDPGGPRERVRHRRPGHGRQGGADRLQAHPAQHHLRYPGQHRAVLRSLHADGDLPLLPGLRRHVPAAKLGQYADPRQQRHRGHQLLVAVAVYLDHPCVYRGLYQHHR